MEADEWHNSPKEACMCVCVWTTGKRCFRLALKCLTSDEKQMFAEMFAAKLL